MADHVTGISLRDVRKLLEEKPIDDAPLDAVSKLLDAAILLSPLIAGPVVGASLLVLVEPKNALVELGRDAIRKFAKPDSGDYMAQATRFAAANCLLTYTAYFDALNRRLPDLMKQVKFSGEDKKQIAEGLTGHRSRVILRKRKKGQRDFQDGFYPDKLADRPISVPHPVNDGLEDDVRFAMYGAMSWRVIELLTSYEAVWAQLGDGERDRLSTVVTDKVPVLAQKLYRDGLVGLSVDFPQFLTWLLLTDQHTKDALIRKLGADVRTEFELTGRALDLGFKDLAEQMEGFRHALAALGAPLAGGPIGDDLVGVASDLHTRYLAQIGKPVIEDSYKPADGPKLGYPTIDESYVPQAYRLAFYDETAVHLEQDETWTARPVGGNLGDFLVRYLDSAYSTQQPLLILGHPGSGKSLLTRLLAARLAYPGYTTIRVELRDADPKMNIQQQIETQIYNDISQRVTWAKFARAMPAPPVVILDGYDELLQATGSTHADYLAKVQRFQQDEADLHRPVRVIVTSRLALIDKVSIPYGTTIARLEEFDEPRRAEWTKVWNDHNTAYFAETGVEPFELPGNPSITDLAAQPLLLLMLALYDSAANDLSSQPDIDQTQLYHELLTRFIRRELDKDASGFRSLPEADQKARLGRELDRLGVVAIGTFNRQTLVIRRDELDKDLRYFAAEQRGTNPGPPALSPAELLIGSFFFIHVSRSRLAEAPADPTVGPAAFEFLHKTFGEFLTAEYLLSQVLAQTGEVADLAGDPRREATLQRHLELLDEVWFTCLVHTPLYTQPNVLAMLSQRGTRRLGEGTRSRAELLAALDQIILAQLRGLLTATTLPPLATRDRNSPYEPQPVLGHLAIYSLNLILLRAYLSDEPLFLNENDLGGRSGACRPWDRLTATWRAWFPPEGLAALASTLTATRRGTAIAIEPHGSPLARATGTPLAAAYNVSLAFGDNLTLASHGLNLIQLEPTTKEYLDKLSLRVADGDETSLGAALDVMRWRASSRPGGELEINEADIARHYGLDVYPDFPPGYLPPGLSLDHAEVANRVLLSPARREGRRDVRPDMGTFARLPRYVAEVIVHYNASLQPEWLVSLVGDRQRGEWRELLAGPGAAPVLHALLRQGGVPYSYLPADPAFTDQLDTIFDADTAASLAIIAWQADLPLCIRALDVLIHACKQGSWALLEIPAELWSPLTDILISGKPGVKERRKEIAKLIKLEPITSAEPDSEISMSPIMMEFLIHALRIGVPFTREYMENITAEAMKSSWLLGDSPRRWLLLLIRWARENNNRAFIKDIFSRTSRYNSEKTGFQWQEVLGIPRGHTQESLDADKFALSLNLTYRETTDLRWAIEVNR